MLSKRHIVSRSLLLIAPRQLAWVSEELPALQPYEVLVQTRVGAISIGSELPHYSGRARHTKQRPYPYMTGYESVGIVLDCGSEVKYLRRGDRVVTFYGHRTHAIVPENKALPVPGDISDAVALLAILSCDVAKGISKVAPRSDDEVLVTGAGAIGLLTVFMLNALGISGIDVSEPEAGRCALALQLGARRAQSPQHLQVEEQRAYPVGIECSSRNAAFEFLQAQAGQAGRICILADGNIEPLVLTPAFHKKELQIVGSSDGLDYQEHARWFFRLERRQLNKLEQIFDYKTTANELISIFEGLADGTIKTTKVFVRYDP